MAPSGSLNTKQDVALAALMKTTSIEEAAGVAKVGTRTLYRWLKEDEAFRAAYMAARREAMSHAISQLQRASRQAVATLEKIMETEDEPAGARVSAAKTVLEMATKGIEVLDLERRISVLEAGGSHTNGRTPWT